MDLSTDIQYSDIIGIYFWGSTSVLMIFIFFIYIKVREHTYLFYSVFLFFTLIYGLTQLNTLFNFNSKFLTYFQENWRYTEPSLLISYGCYILFSIYLLGIKAQAKSLYKLLLSLVLICFVYAFIFFLFYKQIYPIRISLFKFIRIFIFSFSIYALIRIYLKIKSPFKFYFLIGSLFYFIGSLFGSIQYLKINFPFQFFGNLSSTAYFELGILLQSIFFAMAIGQHIHFLHKEREKMNQVLIQELITNNKFTLEHNKSLVKEVIQHRSELSYIKEELEEQERKQSEIELNSELIKSEIRAKQAQVNPHFIYNSLNALKLMILKDENHKAANYLVKFSRLIRVLLDRIDENGISLESEIEYIQNYLELEKERFVDLEYSIEIDRNLNLAQYPIPPLLLQPLVTNALWSFLSVPNTKQKFSILINEIEGILEIQIRSFCNKKSLNTENESFKGIKLVEERILLFNKQNEKYHISLITPKSIKESNKTKTRDCILLRYNIK